MFSKIIGWIGVLALVGICLFFWRSNENLKNQSETTKAKLEQLQKDCDAERLRQQNLQAQIDQFRDPGNRIVTMKGTPIAPEAFAAVLWNAAKKQAHLDIGNLPTPPTGKQYQLWAIVAGKPVDMGVFDIAEQRDTLKTIAFEQAPQAFAVTLENEGGSPVPTLEMMYVVGTF